MLDFHRSHDDPFTMLLFRAPNPAACGIAELDAEGRVVSFVEKPKEPASDLANGGVYIVDADAYREIAALKAFDLGFEVLPRFVGRMRGWATDGYHLDVGTHEALAQARADAPRVLADRRAARPAMFLDRDGTVIEHVHYLADPAKVRLLPDAGPALRRLQGGWLRPGRGHEPVGDRPGRSRRAISKGQRRDGPPARRRGGDAGRVYYCPEVPSGDDRTTITHGDRKPGPGMLIRASKDLGLDLSRSWMIGDMISDALAGINAGCLGSFLVETGTTPVGVEAEGVACSVSANLSAVADLLSWDRPTTQ